MSSPFPRWQIWAVHSTRNGVPPEPEPPAPPVEEPAAELPDVPRETPPPEGQDEAPPPAAAKKRR